MPFDHCRRLDEYQGVEDPRAHAVKAHPPEPIGGMKPEAARALPPQDDQLMSQGDNSNFIGVKRIAVWAKTDRLRDFRISLMP